MNLLGRPPCPKDRDEERQRLGASPGHERAHRFEATYKRRIEGAANQHLEGAAAADMAKDLSPLDERHHMAIEVRTNAGPAFQAAFIYKSAQSTT